MGLGRYQELIQIEPNMKKYVECEIKILPHGPEVRILDTAKVHLARCAYAIFMGRKCVNLS